MDGPARIVLLNGAGSAGKSSIASALQAIAGRPLLHVQMDAFFDMLPAAYRDHPDTFAFETGVADGHPVVAIRAGPVGARLMRGMRRSVAALAGAGNDLVVDDVMLGDEMADYDALLAGFRVFKVGVFAPLAVLEAREAARGDRLIGLARWQVARVHAGRTYDLEVDGSVLTAAECAAQIAERFRL
ncbi:chloramphenicol phosphotransferase [Thalassobaculum sp.]|uniref:chloramphenicol phosphotransferase CPT family protein n=1 Tax=Thalassobaculum sp. TaxID=2022740 RepID=UPI0032EDE102